MDEIWKDIPEYEGHYQISNLGLIKSLKNKKEKILKLSYDKDKYLVTSLYKNNKVKNNKIHRLVMLTFKSDDYFDGAEVNHINGVKTDNNLDNLEWCTHNENMKHAIKTGLKDHKGEKNSNCRLTEDEVRKIRFYYKNKDYNQIQLSKIFNTSRQHIGFIINYKKWTHI